MSTVEAAEGSVEWRVAPRGEPLASCAFEWPAGWTATAPAWVPPGRLQRAWLCGLRGPDGGALDVWVMRFGVEVDGLAALGGTLERPLTGARWTGLPLAEARADDGAWAVVHAGPAVFALHATGPAIAALPRAARSLHSLTDWPPIAETLAPLRIGPLETLRLAAWQAPAAPRTPLGHHRAMLTLEDPTAILLARIEVLVVDCRIFVGYDPHEALRTADARLAVLGIEPGGPSPALDPGPSGPARARTTAMTGPRGERVVVEHRRAVRRIGRGLVVVDGVWRPDAPVARLNGRRHQDILLATGACP